mmetsp:Transcript_5658/g.8717  ORF Transcript_5658/g.8717 Transcript_5658/m.8717 type:complete len:206 (+) Transcript_5658:1771-2388(+)
MTSHHTRWQSTHTCHSRHGSHTHSLSGILSWLRWIPTCTTHGLRWITTMGVHTHHGRMLSHCTIHTWLTTCLLLSQQLLKQHVLLIGHTSYTILSSTRTSRPVRACSPTCTIGILTCTHHSRLHHTCTHHTTHHGILVHGHGIIAGVPASSSTCTHRVGTSSSKSSLSIGTWWYTILSICSSIFGFCRSWCTRITTSLTLAACSA